jgi:outer membrane protein
MSVGTCHTSVFSVLLALVLPLAGFSFSEEDLASYVELESQEQSVGLIETYQRALKNSERIATAQEGYLQSVYQKKQVKSVLYPDISLEWAYFRQEQILSTGLPGQSFLLADRRTYFATIEQTLFSGFREINGLKLTDSLIRSSSENIRDQQNDLLLDVSQAFYDSLKLQREVETLEEGLELQRERLREIEARQKVGLARRTEVLLIGTQLSRDESQLLRSKNGLQTARERLNFLVGEPVEGKLVDDIPEEVPALETDQLVHQAIAMRADLRAAESLVDVAQKNVNVVRADYWPELTLNGNLYAHREGIQEPVDWDVELVLRFPIFFGRDTRARELQALSRLRQAELEKQQLERQIHLEVKNAMLDWLSSDALIQSLQKELDLANENYQLIQEEYRIGLATNLEVLVTYNSLLTARLELEKEKISRKFVWIRLQTALGENPVLGAGKS